MSDLVKEIEDKEKLNSQLQRKAAALSTAQEQYQRLGDDIEYLDEAIPQRPQLIRSLKILEKLTVENDVLIDNLRVPEIPEENNNQLISHQNLERIDLYVNLRVMGDYPAIRGFIEELHQIQRSFVVDEVSFMIDEQGQQQALKANMSVRIPYFGDQNDQQVQTTTQ
jgi:Tfp pilus assembly protein PilO